MTKPSKEILETLAFKIQDEGLDYCFNFYSDWKEITDPNFRLLVKAYKDARESLETFLNDTWGVDKILDEDKLIVGEDMICPITKKHCDDECCPVGAICNLSGWDDEKFRSVSGDPI